jgi:hypothetical protein
MSSSANASPNTTPANLNISSQEGINTLVKRLFFHCDSQYAVQVFNEEKKEWEYNRVVEPVTDELIEKHLKGEITLGAYAWSPEGTCGWVCFDFDKVDMDKIRKLCDYLRNRFGKAYLAEQSVTGDTPILTEKGLLPIEKVIEDYQKGENFKVLTLTERNKAEFKPIRGYHVGKKKVYEVYYEKSAIPLRATGDHSVFVLDPETYEIKEKRVSELKQEDYLITFTKVENGSTIEEPLAKVGGYYLSDGTYKGANKDNATGLVFQFSIDEKEYAEEVKKLLTGVGLKVKNHTRLGPTGEPNMIEISINSTDFAREFIEQYGKADEKRIPPFVWEWSRKSILDLLHGFFRGDGTVHKNFLEAKVTATRKLLVAQLVWLCKFCGLSVSIRFNKDNPHYCKLIGREIRSKGAYVLSVPREEVPFEDFRRERQVPSSPIEERFPTEALRKLYNSLPRGLWLGKPRRRDFGSLLKKKRLSRRVILKFLSWIKEHIPETLSCPRCKNPNIRKAGKINGKQFYRCPKCGRHFKEFKFPKELEKIEKVVNSDIGLVKVKKVVESGVEKVYDISVEGERFFGGCYPVLLHNTGGRGIHIWLFFTKPVPIPVARTIGTTIATKLGLECEVYPASEEHMSLVKVPLGLHRKTGNPSVLIEPESLSEIVPVEVPDTLIDTIMQKYQAERKEREQGFVAMRGCVAVARICQGVEEGCRNEAGFYLARLIASTGIDSAMTIGALKVWGERCKPTVPEKELETIVRSVYGKKYSLGFLSLKKHELLGRFCEGCTKEICKEIPERKRKEKEKELKETLKGIVRTFRRL